MSAATEICALVCQLWMSISPPANATKGSTDANLTHQLPLPPARMAAPADVTPDLRLRQFSLARGSGSLQRLLARKAQPLRDISGHAERVLAQARGHAQRKPRLQGIEGCNGRYEFRMGHGAIPLVFKALAKACTAREQCVLTLPWEQPIVAAVSATSSSSQ